MTENAFKLAVDHGTACRRMGRVYDSRCQDCRDEMGWNGSKPALTPLAPPAPPAPLAPHAAQGRPPFDPTFLHAATTWIMWLWMFCLFVTPAALFGGSDTGAPGSGFLLLSVAAVCLYTRHKINNYIRKWRHELFWVQAGFIKCK